MRPESLSDFAPAGWLANRHLQSILPNAPFRRALLRRRAAALVVRSCDLFLDCGYGVRLHGWHTPQPAGRARGMVVLIHGWEGTGESSYLLSAATRLYAEGWEVIRLHLRDHGPSHHLNEELFHSNRIEEVIGAVACIASTYSDLPLCLGGFSLGGNFALRVAARADARGIRLARVMAVCPVLEPASTLAAMEGRPRIYERYFMAKWRRSLELKAKLFPARYQFGDLRRFRGLREMTAYFVERFSEFPDLDTYLASYAITGDVLGTVSVPTLVVAAADDPVIPAKDLSRLAPAAGMTVMATQRGGHCGFLASLNGASWVDDQMAHWFAPAGMRR